VRPNASLKLFGASGFNLQQIDAEFPLELLIAITGVSGSGKSTLVQRTLAPAIREQLGLVTNKPAPYHRLTGVEKIDRLVLVDQRPLGRTSRGCTATYTGAMDEIRKLYAATKMARGLGLTAAHFSFNSARGWCEACKGAGLQKITMTFLPDLQVTCPVCHGNRFNAQTLRVRYRERTIADVLRMSIQEAMAFFDGFAKITQILQSLSAVGLDHLTLGQSSSTLSGGEAQRVRLATELTQTATRHNVYILDEPTTGLHFEDVRRLLAVLRQLVAQDNTVIVIEHHLDVIKSADWVIDIGPDGGEAGGQIVAVGTPEQIADSEASITGAFLRERLGFH
jgi:excinuclease ABC subunit A